MNDTPPPSSVEMERYIELMQRGLLEVVSGAEHQYPTIHETLRHALRPTEAVLIHDLGDDNFSVSVAGIADVMRIQELERGWPRHSIHRGLLRWMQRADEHERVVQVSSGGTAFLMRTPTAAPAMPNGDLSRKQRKKLLGTYCNMCTATAEAAGRAKLQVCARCGIARYCGRECQRKAWPVHRLRCKLLSEGKRERERERKRERKQADDPGP